MSKDSGSRTLGFPASPRNHAIREWFETASAGHDALRTLAHCMDMPFGNTELGGPALEKGRANPFSEVRIGDHLIERPTAIVEPDGPEYTSKSIWRAILDGEPANGIYADISENRDSLVLIRLTDGWSGEEVGFTRTGHITHHQYHMGPQRLISYVWHHVNVPASLQVHTEQVGVHLNFREDGTMSTCQIDGFGAMDCLEGRGAPLVYGSPTRLFDLSEVSLRGAAGVTGTVRLGDRISSLSRNAGLSALNYLGIRVDESVDASALVDILQKSSLKSLQLKGDRDQFESMKNALQAQTNTKITLS